MPDIAVIWLETGDGAILHRRKGQAPSHGTGGRGAEIKGRSAAVMLTAARAPAAQATPPRTKKVPTLS